MIFVTTRGTKVETKTSKFSAWAYVAAIVSKDATMSSIKSCCDVSVSCDSSIHSSFWVDSESEIKLMCGMLDKDRDGANNRKKRGRRRKISSTPMC